jgi:hypothetical protein
MSQERDMGHPALGCKVDRGWVNEVRHLGARKRIVGCQVCASGVLVDVSDVLGVVVPICNAVFVVALLPYVHR